MSNSKNFDVIIIGGSYSGLAAGMALGRSLKKVLIIDSGKPCNRQTPHSHNFITHDGKAPAEIAALARQQVERYDTVKFLNGVAVKGTRSEKDFRIDTDGGESFVAKKLVFATGVKDNLPPLKGLSECWGISVLHCPYCHGYEVRHEATGILGNGDGGFEFCTLISNWTNDLTLFTNGASTLSGEQTEKLKAHSIRVVEKEIEKIEHTKGYIQHVVFKDGTKGPLKAMYTRIPFEQHCPIPQALGCELNEEGHIKVDGLQKTNVPGVFACGDSTTRMRAVSIAVSSGSMAGMAANREIIFENF